MTCPHSRLKMDGLYMHRGTCLGVAWTCLDCRTSGATMPHLMTREQVAEAEAIYRTGKQAEMMVGRG